MKKKSFRILLYFGFILCSIYTTAQDTPPSDDTFRLRNVETGQFLTTAQASAQPVTMTNLAEEDQSTHWIFVVSGAYYNIDSQSETGGIGILRAPGSGGPGGPYVVVSTLSTSPNSSTDKTWTIQHNATNDTYRFESRTAGRYLYHDANGTVTHVAVSETDDRSNWELIPYVDASLETAPDEDTNPDLTCPASGEFQNDNTRNVDIPNAVNVGTADDRTCYSDYSESNVYGKTWGVYNISNGSNHWDGSSLQPRIERSLPRSETTGVGSYARFTGVVRILEVGDAGNFNEDGSYLIQAKGKHTGGGGPADPAICLYLAKPVYGTGINSDKQVAFNIYAERILERGGSGSSGREVVFLKQVNKNEEIDFELEVGFREDPNDASQKIHYCDAVISGDTFTWSIPEPNRGIESGIRYGVYRVKGGRAQMRWANTTYQKVEVADPGNGGDIEEIYRLKNVATGKYLTASDSSIITSDSGEGSEKEWKFVEAGVSDSNYYNIDSQGPQKIIRFTGGSSNPQLICTNFASPNTDTDKIWTIIEHGDGTVSFETRNLNRYLYHASNDIVTHSANTDDRSKWILESTTLGLIENDLSNTSVKIYPNPANDQFTIALNKQANAEIKIFNTLGTIVYQGRITNGKIEIRNNNLTPGLYMVTAVTPENKLCYSKLIIK